VVVHLHQRQIGDFQSLFGFAGLTSVEFVQAVGLFATVVIEAAIHRCHPRVAAGDEGGQTQPVELDQVELSPEPSGVSFFIELAVATQMAKVRLAPQTPQGGQQDDYQFTLRCGDTGQVA